MDRIDVASSNVTSIGYDEQSATLEVGFYGGQVYQYYGVPSSVYDAIMHAPSKGQFLHHQVKNVYPYSRTV